MTVNEPDEDLSIMFASDSALLADISNMQVINEYLKEHRWACKGPVRMVYKYNGFYAGRLITDFQNLPQRRFPIRINTKIDDEDICEVDFSANHLRLNLASHHGQAAGETPYEDIADLCKPVTRERVKLFITAAMGADSEEAAFAGLRRYGLDRREFDLLKVATLKRFPKLTLFSSYGLLAQELEGKILMHVMLEGVRLGKVVLPIHDACAVTVENAQWAEDAMKEYWLKCLDCEDRPGMILLKKCFPNQ